MLKKGIYENLISQGMEREIHTAEAENLVCVREEIDNTEAPQMLADYLAKAIRQKLQVTEDLQDRMTGQPYPDRIWSDGRYKDSGHLEPADGSNDA